MISREYKLPLVGAIKNWRTLSGDENDPIRPIGLQKFASNFQWVGDERTVRMQTKTVDLDEGSASVIVTAAEEFHKGFAAYLRNRSLQNIAAMGGREVLKRRRTP